MNIFEPYCVLHKGLNASVEKLEVDNSIVVQRDLNLLCRVLCEAVSHMEKIIPFLDEFEYDRFTVLCICHHVLLKSLS